MNMMNEFQTFVNNPSKFMMNRMGIPADIANDPNAIIQHLMNTGKLSQNQYNMARNEAAQMQKNPMFQRFMNGK